MRIIFVDLNNSLVEKVKGLGIEAICADYFAESYMIDRPVLMTASNPHWSFGGGIDAEFWRQFYGYCQYKNHKGGENERIGNICFTQTVDKWLKSSKEIIKKAVLFAIEHTKEGETLVLSGVGTGIGQLSEGDFVEVLKEVIETNGN